MAIDLSKLTPAPWYRRTDEYASWGWINAGDDKPVADTGMQCRVPKEFATMPWGDERIAGPPEIAANAEFIALARNAFEVMTRRKWGVVPCGSHGWCVVERVTDSGEKPDLIWVRHEEDDPFTALVEADKWYAIHVESTGDVHSKHMEIFDKERGDV